MGMSNHDFDREQQIVDQALRLFSQEGYHGTSLQGIADNLGITRPAFYYYFRSKDDLLWKLIGNLGDRLLEEVRPVVKERVSPKEKLRRLIDAHVRTVLSDPDAFQIYFTERHVVAQQRDRQLRRGETQYMKLYQTVITEGQKAGVIRDGDAHLLALIVIGIANSPLRWFERRGRLSPAEAAELLADMAVGAVSSTEVSVAPQGVAQRVKGSRRATTSTASIDAHGKSERIGAPARVGSRNRSGALLDEGT